jgi:Zn-dependent peptidase ImmA (M78 family)
MININGEEWRIALVPPLDPVLLRSDHSYTIGVCDDITKTIYINKELNQKYIQKVLCHELTHAAMFSYNIELTWE